MQRETIARLVLRASYPATARPAGETEIVSTLLEAGEVSTPAFCRELASLLGGGLRARALDAQDQPAARLVLAALAYAGLALNVWLISRPFALSESVSDPRALWETGLLASVLLYGIGWRRAAATCGLIAAVILFASTAWGPVDLLWIGGELISFAAMAALPPRRLPWRQRVLRLAATLAILAAGLLLGGWPLGWWLMAAAGLLALPWRPALTLGVGGMLAATGVFVGLTGSPMSPSVALLLSAAPLTLVLLFAGRRLAGRAAR